MSEEDWSRLGEIMDRFGTFLSYIPYGNRDKGWWDIFYAHDNLLKAQIKKLQLFEQRN